MLNSHCIILSRSLVWTIPHHPNLQTALTRGIHADPVIFEPFQAH